MTSTNELRQILDRNGIRWKAVYNGSAGLVGNLTYLTDKPNCGSAKNNADSFKIEIDEEERD